MKAIIGSLFVLLSVVAHAQTTAFTYQGKLNSNGTPVSGGYVFPFTIYDSLTNGNAVSSSQTATAVPVTNGLFTAQLNFGPGVFNGSDRWLDIAVRTNGGGSYVSLTPRQPLTSTPSAIQAGNA